MAGAGEGQSKRQKASIDWMKEYHMQVHRHLHHDQGSVPVATSVQPKQRMSWPDVPAIRLS